MQKFIRSIIAMLCTLFFATGLISCSMGTTVLAEAATPESLSSEEWISDNLLAIKQSANDFASQLASALYKNYSGSDNFVAAPISAYMALAVAAECASGTTRDEILSALGITYDQLSSDVSLLYRLLEATYETDGKITGMLDLTNSIWIDKSYNVNKQTITSLAEKYFCYSRATDFNNTSSANRAIKSFVKDKTHDLIDLNFNLPSDTVFAIVNTLYLKDMWNYLAKDLSFTDDKYTFKSIGGEKETKLLQGSYIAGRAYETDTFTHYYVQTHRGYKIKFILPKEGYSVKDVFTAQSIAEINALTDYNANDDENRISYYTRCLFPEFTASYSVDIKSALQSTFDINTLFDTNACDFTSLTDNAAFCNAVPHAAQLKVSKKGIEGASVIIFPGPGAPGPGPYEEVYVDFVVDGSFGFIITDRYDTVLFSGVVENI
ncbi:MAG: hypothetical protein J1F36_06250 [Clostridiales bacterium]|nr:hypothetical protein [Clostridiales bacterium]